MAVSLLKNWSSNEQSFVDRVKEHLVDTVGWSLVTTLSGVSTDHDYVFSSAGENPGNNDTVYIRVRGYADNVYLYGYSYFEDLTTYSGEIHHSVYSRVYAGMSDFDYWIFADKDHLKFALYDTDTDAYYHGYAGLIDTYYNYYDDTLPLLIYATQSGTSYWGDGLSPYMTTATGSVVMYNTWSTYNPTYGDSSRGNLCGGHKLILYHTLAPNREVRGEPKGVLQISPSCGGRGLELLTTSGTYYTFAKSGTQNYAYMYGPVGPTLPCPTGG